MKSVCECRVLFLTILILVQILNGTAREYSKILSSFPPLYNFDDYDVCLNSRTSTLESTYCMVYAEIRPQNSSDLWREISQHIKSYKFHYRRDRLFFGVCMERCKNFPELLDNLQYNDSKVANQVTEFFDAVHKRPLDLIMRSAYHALVHNCLNSEFQNKFNLSLRTFIEYCERPGENVQADGPEKIMYKVLEILLILNILSSLYDLCLKRKQPIERRNSDFYKINLQQPVSQLLTAFSIRRNYYRLVEPYGNQLGIDLSYLDGLRSISAIVVVIGHVFFSQYHHVKNPDGFEAFAKSKFHLGLENVTLILEIFHVLSGMLLLIKFKDQFKINSQSSFRDCIQTYCRELQRRYIRFLPTVALFVGVTATFFTRLQDGPFWRHLTEAGRTFGREKLLKNLLIVDISESGFPHTWYLTTDMQLFAFYSAILIIIHKYPQYKRNILSSLAILAVAIPGGICYSLKLEPCYLVKPESFRFAHAQLTQEERSFFRLYTPFYTNLGGYLFGIVCGEVYENYRQNTEFCKKISRIPRKIFECAFWCCIAIGLWICWLGAFVVLKEPSIWTALYGGLNRNLFVVIFCGALVLMGMFCRSLSAMSFLSHPAFRILARLSFQIYMWHFPVMYLINGHKREPIYTNHLQYFSLAICMFLFSVVLAFLITIFVEYPFQQIANYYYKKEIPSKKPHNLKS